MTVYLINIALILVEAYLFRNNRKWYCIIVAIQWILISGLRHWSIGADTYSYKDSFDTVKNTPWNEIFKSNWEYITTFFEDSQKSAKDPGYKLLVKTFQVFSEDYQMFLVFIAIVFTLPMAIWVYKNSSMPCLSFIIYSTLFYSFYAVTGHRQTIATALIVFVGYKYIKERKPIKFLIISFISFMIHKSSIAFVPYYFLANMNITGLKSICILGLSLLLALFGKSIYAPLAESLGYGEGMIEYSGGGAEMYATVLLLICIVSLLCYTRISERRIDAKFLYNAIFLTILTTLFVYQHQGFMRIQQYYSLFIMLMIPEIVMSFEAREQMLVCLGGGGFLIVYLILQNPHYAFFFQ